MSSHKRSRAAFETDSETAQVPFVFFGTVFPHTDSHDHDGGSYVPIHKQEVRDERGRRRLHGAFTGGWTAGYFNTVGSKEGWAPSTFVSNRAARRNNHTSPSQQRPEDFMDDEDLADAAETEKIQTTDSFAGIGNDHTQVFPQGNKTASLARPNGSTMGHVLLRKMGWKDGQGIGPKVRRVARVHDNAMFKNDPAYRNMFLFAPDIVATIRISRKTDRMGLGYVGEGRLGANTCYGETTNDDTLPRMGEDQQDALAKPSRLASSALKRPKRSTRKGATGVGVLNDTGSDDEDPFSIGPRISYNRTLGSDKIRNKEKKLAPKSTAFNPKLGSKPTFVTKRPIAATGQHGSSKCHDGLSVLTGFVLPSSDLTSAGNPFWPEAAEPPPAVPHGWIPSKQHIGAPTTAITGTVAPIVKHDHWSRAAALEETQLPGKSVFDYVSPEARERIVSASGRTNLPEAKGKLPPSTAVRNGQKAQEMIEELPMLDQDTAKAAINRGYGARGPYADDEGKQSRYLTYLEHAAGLVPSPLEKPAWMVADDFARELSEFRGCARLFRPMTGLMATRFTTSSSLEASTHMNGHDSINPLNPGTSSQQRIPSHDPAEEAAKLGLYGRVTRSVHVFLPTRLLCKRFNVRTREHSRQQPESSSMSNTEMPPSKTTDMQDDSQDKLENPASGAIVLASQFRNGHIVPDYGEDPVQLGSRVGAAGSQDGHRPSDDVFKAIFGDSSDEET